MREKVLFAKSGQWNGWMAGARRTETELGKWNLDISSSRGQESAPNPFIVWSGMQMAAKGHF